ncbi:MAG: helix-turn-helix transcriptional regulator [Chloroflexi bacterium]|nr:helix-turn-helix transcriptional regulator [Chloroflexota bacterium]
MLEARPPSVAAPPPGDQPAEPQRADELATEVAKAVRELRADAGLSERAAARLLGTSQTQLRRMEDPRYLPSLRSLARVAAAYGHRLQVAFEPRVSQGASRVAPGSSRDRQPARVAAGGPKTARPTRSKGAARAKRPATARAARTRPRRRA